MHYKNFKKCCDYKNENVYFPVMELKFKQRVVQMTLFLNGESLTIKEIKKLLNQDLKLIFQKMPLNV